MTASRYCPNGHDIYLDTELADEPARVRRTPLLDDEDDADD
jgi:hypothetical protein